MKTTLTLTLLAVAALSVAAPKTEMNAFIDDLMGKMTVEEKIGQLNLPTFSGEIVTGQATNNGVAQAVVKGQVGGVFNLTGVERVREMQRLAVEESRLGIPLIFGLDVVHGYETTLPIPLALSCSWDMDAIERSARIAATEASADGICWTFSPMVDISRDPRWGRVAEGGGEDPFLGSAIAQAMVRGYQGPDKATQLQANNQIMACVKHFALYGASEAGRDYNPVDMSRIRMYNEYLPPYRAALEAGAGSVMSSFNEIDGVPATANRWLLTKLLREEWGFGGFVVSDYTSLSEMIDHGIGDLQTVSARALRAGLDMDMVSHGFVRTLKKSLDEGKVSQAEIDRACRRILEAKWKLGLFADPYKYCDPTRRQKEIFSPEHRAAAREIASKCFVLLKNAPAKPGQAPILPLRKQGTVAVVGPLADSRANMHGTWSVSAKLDACPSLVEGLRELTKGQVEILYAKGSNLMDDPAYEHRATLFGRSLHRDNRTAQQLLDEALATAAKADVIVAALGESSEMNGECACRTDLGLPDAQRRLLEALLKTGKPVVLTLFTGRPLTLQWEHANVPAILCVWFGGSETAYAVGDVLFGDVNPSGKLTMTFPKNVGQIPLFYNHKNTGRPITAKQWFTKYRSNYIDVDNDPLYPFGYGLSYTTFHYGNIRLDKTTIAPGEALTATVTLTNAGDRDGAEIVQLYIRDRVGSVTRPVKELKGFRKVFLKAGESRDVSFTITEELLKFYDYDLNHVAEPGDFDVMIGGDSHKVKSARFTLR